MLIKITCSNLIHIELLVGDGQGYRFFEEIALKVDDLNKKINFRLFFLIKV